MKKFEGLQGIKRVNQKRFFFFETGKQYIIFPKTGYYLLRKRQPFSIMIPLKNCTFMGTNINVRYKEENNT